MADETTYSAVSTGLSYGPPAEGISVVTPDSTPINPQAAIEGMIAADQAISDFVGAVESEIQAGLDELASLIGPAIAQLQSWVQKQITQLNNTLGSVYAALITIVQSEQFLLNTGLATTLSNIGQQLGLSNADIIGGPPPIPGGVSGYGMPISGGVPPFPTPGGPPYPPYPGPGGPPYPPYPGPGGPPYPPNPQQPYPGINVYCPPYPPQPSPGGGGVPPFPSGPGVPSPPGGTGGGPFPTAGGPGEGTPAPSITNNLTINNVTNTVTQITETITSTQTVTYNSNVYQPTFNVYNNGGGITIGSNGLPEINVSYDVQLDNSIVVNIGPVSVHVAVPPSPTNPNAPVCPLVPVGSDGGPPRA